MLKEFYSKVRELPIRIVLIIGFSATFLLSASVTALLIHEEQKRFEAAVEHIATPIRNRIRRYEITLVQTRAFFIALDGKVSQDLFDSYMDAMQVLETSPGAQGLGFSVVVPDEKIRQKNGRFEFMRQSYKVWPLTPARDQYHSIVYLFPLDWRNKRAISYDMYSNDVRRKAMQRARDTGLPSLTGKVILVQETDVATQPGFLLYVPFYKPGLPTETEEQRRAALVGFVYSPFRAHDFLLATLPQLPKHLGYKLYSDTADTENLMFQADKEQGGNWAVFSTTRELELLGQRYMLEVKTYLTPNLFLQFLTPLLLLILGFGLTYLLYRIVRDSTRAAEVEKQARETVETLNRIGQNVTAVLDLDKLVQDITDAATQMSKAQFGALFYNVLKPDGGAYTLYSLSGAPKEAFSKFPLPRNTKVFNPTFTGEGIVRSDDITKDPRYGKNAPYKGMPEGHLPVRSYLAVPVVSRSGEVLGGLFFGHKDVGVFTEHVEHLVAGLAAQAAVAIDNANLYRQAQEAIAARDEFLSICSHELKTPLTSLQLEAQIYERQMRKQGEASLTSEKFRDMIRSTQLQVFNLTRLVNDMLDISRIATGRIQLEEDKHSLRELLQDIYDQIRPQFEADRVQLIMDAPKQDVQLTCDRQRVVQILNNLLTNALKYGERKPVRMTAIVLGPNLEITVADSGMGIAEEHHERIFNRFERANADKNLKGLGLGLFISRKLAEAHKGRLDLESKVGEGSKFKLVLPV